MELETELIRLASNIVSRISIGRQWAGRDEELAELKVVVMEVEELLGSFDIKDYIWVLQKLRFDLQGIGRRVKVVRGQFDWMVEGILGEKEAARQSKREEKDGREGMMEDSKDILDMLMDVYDDERAEMRLTRDNIKAFILVNFLNHIFFIKTVFLNPEITLMKKTIWFQFLHGVGPTKLNEFRP